MVLNSSVDSECAHTGQAEEFPGIKISIEEPSDKISDDFEFGSDIMMTKYK